MRIAALSPARRLTYTSVHLAATAAVFALIALLVFGMWYPPPFQQMSGGFHLLAILAAVDVVLGPSLTLLVASPSKPQAVLKRDLTVIVAVQLCALAYGMYVLAQARPAWLSFERVQFRVVAAADIESASLLEAPEDLRSISWTGPRLIGAALSRNPDEQLRSMQEGLAGFDLSIFPRNWRPYDSQAERAWTTARPVIELLTRDPASQEMAERLAQSTGKPLDQLRYLPVRTKVGHWSVLLASPGAKVVGYLPIEGD